MWQQLMHTQSDSEQSCSPGIIDLQVLSTSIALHLQLLGACSSQLINFLANTPTGVTGQQVAGAVFSARQSARQLDFNFRALTAMSNSKLLAQQTVKSTIISTTQP